MMIIDLLFLLLLYMPAIIYVLVSIGLFANKLFFTGSVSFIAALVAGIMLFDAFNNTGDFVGMILPVVFIGAFIIGAPMVFISWIVERTIKRKLKKPNKQVDPIVTTPVDEVEAQGTQGHP